MASAEQLYRRLERLREPYLRRAREAVELTIPTLLRQNGQTPDTDLPTPWQGVGARGVNNLSSKLMLALFPPNAPFFRFKVDEGLAGIPVNNAKAKAEVDESLAEMERRVMFEMETSNRRVKLHEAIKHLVATGNALIYDAPDEPVRVFHLDSYVCERGAAGDLLLLITRECVSPMMLPDEFVAQLSIGAEKEDYIDRSEEKTLELFTCIKWDQDEQKWYVHQEIKGKELPDSYGSYTEDDMPFLALRMKVVDGEDYGRGYVEEYLGDLRSLEGLRQAVVEGAAAAARIVVMVRPNSTTKLKKVAEARNGEVIPGHKDDVTMLQAEKQADLRVAKETASEIGQSLAAAFLLNSSVQRDAERVTAEEIRYVAQELEALLGGEYTNLSQELQFPLVMLIFNRLQKAGRLPKLKKGLIKPSIVTGLEALGRGHDLQRLQVAFDVIARTYGPEALVRFTKPIDGITRIFTSSGVDTAGLMKTEEEIAAETQQAQMMETVHNLGPDVIKAAASSTSSQAA